MIRKTTAICAALATAASGLLISTATPASATSTYYACVKKKSGETTMVKKSTKCKKGWKKVKWSAKGPAGPTGQTGPAGKALQVKDANGAVVGLYVGAWGGLVAGFGVMIDGGLWEYQNDGTLWAYPVGPEFTDAACTAPVRFVTGADAAETARYLSYYTPNGPGRFPYRPLVAGAATRGWKISGTNTAAVAGQTVFLLDDRGNCIADHTVTPADVTAGATLVGLTEVTPPANRPGPLTVG